MRIAVDADHLFRYPLRGIQKTTLALYSHLGAIEPAWQVDAFYQVDGQCPALAALPHVRTRRLDIRGDRFRAVFNPWQQVRLPLAARGHDLLHVPSNHGSWWAPCPRVVTVHDLTPIEYPSKDSANWWRNVRRTVAKAARIVTCSRYVADRLIARVPACRERVRVVDWGRPEGYGPVPAADAERVTARYGISSAPYVLTFGTAHPRKNIKRIVSAWHAVPERLTSRFLLVVAGLSDDEICSIAELPATPARVRGLTGITEADLPALYSGAAAVAYLSLSEGFGLPVLEGFACGRPVLASNRTSIPEVAGDAALLVDPASEAEIAAALTRLLDEPGLRDELSGRGLVRASEFDWRRCAAEYASVFRECQP